MIRSLCIVLCLGLGLGLGACISTAAPGTRPGDMTLAEHLQACRSHEQRAKELEIEERFRTNEGYSDSESRYEYDVARQHGKAAKILDPSSPACP
jgi:hypothetical protein